MSIGMHHLSVSFRRFRSALEDLENRSEWMPAIVELDVAIDKAFREAEELTPDLGREIADNFNFILERIGALCEYLVARIDQVQKLMVSAAALTASESEFKRWSSELYTLLNRFQNVSIISGMLREIRIEHGAA